MDIPLATRRWPKGRTVLVVLLFVGAVIVGVSLRGETDVPLVERAGLYIDSAIAGPFVVDVRSPGTMVPEEVRQITAQASARVERLFVQNGETVSIGETIVELSNPDVAIQAMQAEQQARQAQIDLLNLRLNLQNARLTQEAVVVSTSTQSQNASEESRASDSLLSKQMISPREARSKALVAEDARKRASVEELRLTLMQQSVDSQLSVQAAQVDQLRAIAENQRKKLKSLEVHAPAAGVLQDVNLQLGQWVSEGALLAKVVDAKRLKAVLKIPESQARDVQIGQRAIVDLRNAKLAGTVSRKDGVAISGAVAVDIKFDSAVPVGTVPEQAIDGIIELAKAQDALRIRRPAGASAFGTASLFKLDADGRLAHRVVVTFGKLGANDVQVVSGLRAGDKIILSDMSQWDSFREIRLK
jgi:HlyD family secretion protein